MDLENELRAALQAPVPRVEVPPAQDRALIAEAHRRAHQLRVRRVARWGVPAVVAAAAAVMLLVQVARQPAPARSAAAVVTAPADVNRDGQVDILDAWTLAAALEAGGEAPPAWDLNGDAAVDRADVETVARLAVSLEGRR